MNLHWAIREGGGKGGENKGEKERDRLNEGNV